MYRSSCLLFSFVSAQTSLLVFDSDTHNSKLIVDFPHVFLDSDAEHRNIGIPLEPGNLSLELLDCSNSLVAFWHVDSRSISIRYGILYSIYIDYIS